MQVEGWLVTSRHSMLNSALAEPNVVQHICLEYCITALHPLYSAAFFV